MTFNPFYFERYSWNKAYDLAFPSKNLKLIIVIPSYKEPDLLTTLRSLEQRNKDLFEVIVVINEKADEDERIRSLHLETILQIKESDMEYPVHILFEKIPNKSMGVGLARKIGMDVAAKRFLDIKNSNGVIACLDADCIVSDNYIDTLITFQKSGFDACSIYYEHDLEESPNAEAIAKYELHLRYFIHAQRYSGYQQAYQTVGSSMAVKAGIYTSQGGMNTRKAGEDFYFIHKFIANGKFTELNSCTVYPSSRTSDRVPFGTGRAMLNNEIQTTYNPQSFLELERLLKHLEKYGDEGGRNELSAPVKEFISSSGLNEKLEKMYQNSKDQASFQKRLFTVFDAFQVMKFLHYTRDNYYPDVPIEDAATWLLKELGHQNPGNNAMALLDLYRKIDQGIR